MKKTISVILTFIVTTVLVFSCTYLFTANNFAYSFLILNKKDHTLAQVGEYLYVYEKAKSYDVNVNQVTIFDENKIDQDVHIRIENKRDLESNFYVSFVERKFAESNGLFTLVQEAVIKFYYIGSENKLYIHELKSETNTVETKTVQILEIPDNEEFQMELQYRKMSAMLSLLPILDPMFPMLFDDLSYLASLDDSDGSNAAYDVKYSNHSDYNWKQFEILTNHKLDITYAVADEETGITGVETDILVDTLKGIFKQLQLKLSHNTNKVISLNLKVNSINDDINIVLPVDHVDYVEN